MAKIVFTDIIALAKSGWTPSAVKELLKAEEEQKEEPKEEPKEEEPDYKALYEKAKNDLAKVQADNTRVEVTPETFEIDEIVKGIKSRLY